ncbi:hypothetical protein [Verrucomicrobium sp. BvORR034]|uniref:hypothetical protein n=1 Tax=Verrucomicrobium sp. BvORR034 TaxID=1396418 RepID=UPI000679DBCC|nr:hypothetical protein [Verrucomicrobium sp. BvORR034]
MSRVRTAAKWLLIVMAGGWVPFLLLVVQAHRTSWLNVRSLEPRPALPPLQDWRIGDVDEEGNLVFMTMDAFDHTEPFLLRDPYEVLLMNDGTEEAPKARYVVAERATRRITDTYDYAEYLREIQRIPPGSVVGWFDTCSVPRAYGLPDAVKLACESALSAAGLQVETDGRGVCYCPAGY